MIRTNSQAAAATLLFSLLAGTAHATTVPLDDEQSAAAAALSVQRLGEEVPHLLSGLAYSPRDFAERTLRLLEAAYTPAAVARARHGVVVACPGSGSFRAKYSASTRVVEIEWSACRLDIDGQAHILTGPAKAALCADDFTPAYVTSLSVGQGSRDLVERFVINGVPSGPENQTLRNIRFSGYIPFGRETVDHNFEGDFAYMLDGKVENHARIRLPGPDEVYQNLEHRIAANDAWVSGNLLYGDERQVEDIRFNAGVFKQWTRESAVLDQPERSWFSSLHALNLRVRNIADYTTGNDTLEVNGYAHQVFPSISNLTCASGGYHYQTRVPMRHPGEFQAGIPSYDSGEVRLNGDATLSFSANTENPWEIGEMHINLAVDGVGSFGYDGNSIYESGLPAAAACGQ